MKITYPKMNYNALVASNVRYFLLENMSDKKQNVSIKSRGSPLKQARICRSGGSGDCPFNPCF